MKIDCESKLKLTIIFMAKKINLANGNHYQTQKSLNEAQ